MQVHTKSDATNETNILSPNVDNIKETPNGVKKAAVAAAPQARLTKPTVVQVDEYMREYATQHHVPITFTAQGWLDHYESNGWRVGRNPMRDWKAAVRTWFNQRHEYGNTQKARHDPRRGVEAGDASKKDWDSTF